MATSQIRSDAGEHRDLRSPQQTSQNLHYFVRASNEEADDLFDLHENQIEDSASIVGVSISQVQSRLKSHTTPAIEKLAAINAQGGFFSELDGASPEFSGAKEVPSAQELPSHDFKAEEPSRVANITPEKYDLAHNLPSPLRTGPKTIQQNDQNAQLLGFAYPRRSSSGSEKKPISPFQLSDMPKRRILGSNYSPWSARETREESTAPSSDVLRESRMSVIDWRGHAPSPETTEAGATSTLTHQVSQSADRSEHAERHIRPKLGLRRATSDQSLYLTRTLSRASSLGDDKRFENVNEQINSRLKAIRDSWQDVSLRRSIPSLKAPSFSLSKLDLTSQSTSGMHTKGSITPVRATNEQASVAMTGQGEYNESGSKATNSKTSMHPSFTRALDGLTGDIVILGGYRGSVLREAQYPYRRAWLPLLKAGLGLKRIDLELGFDSEDEERVKEKIIPDGMLTHIGPVDISRRLLKRLRTCRNALTGKLRVHEYGYDWRLSPHRLSKQLNTFLASLRSNASDTPLNDRGAIVIAHSLGGLITRHAVNVRPDLFSGVVFAGVPNTCVNILGPLRNGDPVLFNSEVLTAQVNLSIRTSIVLLPLDGRCFTDKDTNEEYRVDFYNPEDWIKYRFSPCISTPLPAVVSKSRPTSLISAVSNFIPDSIVNAMPSLVSRKDQNSSKTSSGSIIAKSRAETVTNGQSKRAETHAEHIPRAGMPPQMDTSSNDDIGSQSLSAGVTISPSQAITYLRRVLPQIKAFRKELAHDATKEERNIYPPFTVIYGKTEPTVSGARVDGRDGIARADAYSSLTFASGDGVVLSRAAQLPAGYRATRGGVVASERGHVTLLGDLEAVGRCLLALRKARAAGVGYGVP